MTDAQVLHGLQAVDEVMNKPELAFLKNQYCLLYQSLIPNCKLTIKILRHHFTITDQVAQYILSGDSRRLCCQRVMNMLLIHLDIVKDHHQFCDWLDSVSVMDSGLFEKIKTEFSASDNCGHKMSAKTKPVHKKSSITAHHPDDSDVDDIVMDNVITSCTVGDEVALVVKASSCTGSRRRLVRHVKLLSTKQPEQTDSALEVVAKERKSDHVKSILNLKCLLNPSEWSIVNTCLPVFCESLPDNYQSTIEKLKTLPQFLGAEQQQQLDSLIPATLHDVKIINEKIITFIVITLSFSSTSGGMTRLCDIMDELIGTTSCVQEVQCVESSGTSSSQPLDHTDSVIVPEIKQTTAGGGGVCSQPVLTLPYSISLPASVPTTGVTVSGEAAIKIEEDIAQVPHQDHPAQPVINNLAKDDDEEIVIPEILSVSEDFSQLKAQYYAILQLMPDEYEHSIANLQSHFSDDQICDILSSSDCKVANNKILNCLVEKMSCKEDLLDLCDQLEKITASHDLRVIIKGLKSGVEQSLQLSQLSGSDSLLSSLLSTHQFGSSGVSGQMFQLAFSNTSLDPNSRVIPILKKNFVGLCRCLPNDYMVTLERMKYKARISDGLAFKLAELPNAEERNGMIIAVMLGPLDSDDDVLGFCDLLEDAVDMDSSKKFIHNLRAKVIEAISMNGKSQGPNQFSANNETSDECISFFDKKIAPQMAVISPHSEVLAVIRKNFSGICHHLPDDYKLIISRIKRTAKVAEGLMYQLALLPSAELAKCHILAAMIKPLREEIHLVGFCDSVMRIVDSAESRKFIENLRKEVIGALTMKDNELSGGEVLCIQASNSDDQCMSFFDQAIAPNMVALDPNCKGFAVLRRNFTELCHCLPHNYKETIRRLKRTKVIPDGLMYQLSKLPNFELANCSILAGLLRPLRQEIDLLEFCDSMEDLIDGIESKRFIGKLRNEIIEALEISGSTEVAAVPTVNTIQPRAIISGATTDVTFSKPQPVANVPVDDVPKETMCTQPPSSGEGFSIVPHSNDSLLTTTGPDTNTTTTSNCSTSPSDGDYALPDATPDTTAHMTTDATTETQ